MLAGGPVSKRQHTASLSSTEEEYMASIEAAKKTFGMKNFINDVRLAFTLGKAPKI